MSIPAIGGVSTLAATPAATAAPDTSALPFLLLTLGSQQATEPTLAMDEHSQATGEAPLADDEAAPLIGWLFDSFAMATPPTRTTEVALTPAPTPTPGPGMPAKLALPATTQPTELAANVIEPEAVHDGVNERLALASAAQANVTSENPSQMPTVLPEALQPQASAAAVMLPSLSSATVTAATPAAPMDGSASPLVADVPDFGADLGERIGWQLDQGLGEATIELHPAELGALTVRIETQAQQAQVHIVAAEPAARALLSQCLPQLRELLGASGLTLTRGQVELGERRGDLGVSVPSPREGRRRVTSLSLVDAYA